MRDQLFANDSLRQYLLELIRSVRIAVKRFPDELIRTTPENVVEAVIAQLDVEPLSVDWDSKRADPLEETTLQQHHRDAGGRFGTPLQVPANKVTWRVAYAGNYEVLFYRASTSSSFNHDARADAAEIVYSVELPQGQGHEAFQQQAQRIEDQIRNGVDWANADIAAWRPTLVDAVERAVADRVQHLQGQEDLAAALNIPLKRSPASQAVTIPVTRRKIVPVDQKPTPTAAAEPAITQAIYEDIVGTIRGVGNSFERLPRTAEKFNEEELRDLLLFILNSNFEGAVAGEMFNGNGKTDLLLRWQDRNAFIGECKIWKGPKAFADAIDQLLGYTVWRDTKAALILFIRGGDATAVIEKADREIRRHPCFVRAVKSPERDGRLNYVMHATDDPAREIQVALLPIVIRQRVAAPVDDELPDA